MIHSVFNSAASDFDSVSDSNSDSVSEFELDLEISEHVLRQLFSCHILLYFWLNTEKQN